MKFNYFADESFISKGKVKYKECNKSYLLKYTLPTKDTISMIFNQTKLNLVGM